MTEVVLLARGVLVAVLVVSGTAKLLDRPGTRTAVAAFGVPARFTLATALGLPLVELAGAGLLLAPGAVGRTGAVLVGLLLAVLTAALLRTLRTGEPVDCHCFGQLGAGPAGRGTVARNAVLVVLAAVAATGSRSVPATLADLGSGSLAVALLVVLVLGAALVGAAGTGTVPPVPAAPVLFTLPDLDGTDVSLAEVVADGLPALVVFTSPSCWACQELLGDLERWQHAEGPVHVVVVSSGAHADNVAKAAEASRLRVLLQQARWVIDAYGVVATPAAVLVGADGALLGEPVYGPEAVRENYAAVRDGLLAQGHTARRPAEVAP